MKFFDGFLVICAFALSIIMTATLFATFAAWGYAALGPYERDLIAAAVGGPPSAAASAITASASAAPVSDEPIVVEFEPITVIGHFRPVREHLAQSPAPVAN
jgi:hypothetical protein